MKKDPSGYWNTIGVKGDSPGHPFRGNQYTDGGGSAEVDRDDTGKKPPKGPIAESDVHAAISTILSDRRSYNTSLNYAVNYARAAAGMTGRELQVQVLYLLNNLGSWRHPDAAKVRETLRRFSKQKPERETYTINPSGPVRVA